MAAASHVSITQHHSCLAAMRTLCRFQQVLTSITNPFAAPHLHPVTAPQLLNLLPLLWRQAGMVVPAMGTEQALPQMNGICNEPSQRASHSNLET